MCKQSSSEYICKTAAVGIKARAIEELLKTKALRNKIVEGSSGSLIGGGTSWLASKGVPGAAGVQNLIQKGHSGLLKADTVIGSVLRGNAGKDSLRYSMFTNSKGAVPVGSDPSTVKLVDRASAVKPLNFLAEATVIPAAVIGLESLRDPVPSKEDLTYLQQPGGTV